MDGSRSHPLPLLQQAICAGRELWGPTLAGTFCFPMDGRDLGPYRLPCTEVPTRHSQLVSRKSSIVHPQILICRATQSLVRIVRHDDVAWLRTCSLSRSPLPKSAACMEHLQMPFPRVCVVSTVCGLKRRPAEAGRWGGGLCGGGRSAHPDTPSRRYCAVASPVQCSLRVVGGRPREGRGADGVGRARHGILPDDISSSQTGPASLHVVSPYCCRCAGLSTCNLPAPTRSRNETASAIGNLCYIPTARHARHRIEPDRIDDGLAPETGNQSARSRG